MQQHTYSYLGIDISKDHLDVFCRAEDRTRRHRFPNTTPGHQALVNWLGRGPTRTCLEASGRYSIDIALALVEAEGIEVMVANPRAIKNFREASMHRSKTDALDAEVLCYLERVLLRREGKGHKGNIRSWSLMGVVQIQIVARLRRTGSKNWRCTAEPYNEHSLS